MHEETSSLERLFAEEADFRRVVEWMQEVDADPPGGEIPPSLRFSDLLDMVAERQDLAPKLHRVLKSFGAPKVEPWVEVWQSRLIQWPIQALEAENLPPDSPESRRALLIWGCSAIDALHRHRPSRFERPSYGIRKWIYLLAGRLGIPESEAKPIDSICESLVEFEESDRSAFALADPQFDPPTAQLIPKVDGFIRPFRLIDTFESRQQNGAMGWDVRCARRGDDVLVGATWHWGNADLWRIPGSRLQKADKVLSEIERGSTPAPATREGQLAAFGYSRRLLLVRLDDSSSAEHHVLIAPTVDPDGGPPCFELFGPADASGSSQRLRRIAKLAVLEQDLGRESVYSMLELEPGLVLIGLRGTNASVRLGLLRLRGADRGARPEYYPFPDIPPVLPSGDVVSRNPVWTLAKLPHRVDDRHVVFAGCEDGRILELQVSSWETGALPAMSSVLVDRLGSPVWNLAVRYYEETAACLRVYAGTANGTVVAYQRLRDVPQIASSRKSAFAHLWALAGNGPVAGMHFVDLPPRGEGSSEVLLVLSQGGIGLVIHDPLALPLDARFPTRQPLPGRRVGRFDLGTTTCFASAIVPCSTHAGNPLFLVCSGEHRMSLFELLPTAQQAGRSREIRDSMGLWCGTVESSDPAALALQCQRIRLLSAISGAAPAFSLYVVQWILRKGVGLSQFSHEEQTPLPNVRRCWLPKHLRPLFDLAVAWERVSDDEPQIAIAIDALQEVLRRNHARDDRELFDQVVSTVLTRLNRFVATIAYHRPTADDGGHLSSADGAREERACRFAVRVLSTIEHFSGLWGGTRDETQSLVFLVRSLFDGDTLWALSTRLTEDTPATEAQRWMRIFERRGHMINSLLSRGHRSVASEVMRAGNMALFRAALRHSAGRRSTHGIPWSVLEKYFHAIGEVAAQSLRAGTGTRTLMAHEVTRAFALALQLCPHDAIAIAHRYLEAVPPEIKAMRVLGQVEVLRQLGLVYPPRAMDHFEYALTLDGFPTERLRGLPRRHSNDRKLAHQLEVVRRLVKWVESLAASFRSAAFRIPLGEAEVHLKRLRRLFPNRETSATGRRGDVRHSGLFWEAFLSALVDVVKKHEVVAPSAQISPRLVLVSERLRVLCDEHLASLKSRFEKHQVFEPHVGYYERALTSLRDETANFRKSAELQRNLVLGMLNHGLLEALDEHVLELEEIALALNPVLVGLPWRSAAGNLQRSIRPLLPYHDKNSPQEKFATYVINRARKAETIPKNLRALQSMLNHEEMLDLFKNRGRTSRSSTRLSELVAEYVGPLEPGDRADVALDQSEERHLRIALEELFQNHEVHGQEKVVDSGPTIEVRLRCSVREITTLLQEWERSLPEHYVGPPLPMERRLWIENSDQHLEGAILRFPLYLDLEKDPAAEKFKARMKILIDSDLQELIAPREEPYVSSHGTGLYLANLAAAVVGWRLVPLGAILRSTGKGELAFLLYRCCF